MKVKDAFIPSLDTQVEIVQYAKKIHESATRVECHFEDKLIGLCGVYLNDEEGKAFITTISVIPSFQNQGIAQLLMDQVVDHCKSKSNITYIELQVSESNEPARKFYAKNGFQITEDVVDNLMLKKSI